MHPAEYAKHQGANGTVAPLAAKQCAEAQNSTGYILEKPLTVTVKRTCKLLGLGNTTIWDLIGQNKLKTIRVGRRRLVLYSSIESLLAEAA